MENNTEMFSGKELKWTQVGLAQNKGNKKLMYYFSWENLMKRDHSNRWKEIIKTDVDEKKLWIVNQVEVAEVRVQGHMICGDEF